MHGKICKKYVKYGTCGFLRGRSGVPASSRSLAPTGDPLHYRGLPALLSLVPDLKRPCSPFHTLTKNKFSQVSALVHLLHQATIETTFEKVHTVPVVPIPGGLAAFLGEFNDVVEERGQHALTEHVQHPGRTCPTASVLSENVNNTL